MDIQGSRMGMMHEVILSGNEPVGSFGRFDDDKSEGPPRPRIGDVLSIHLSQQANSVNSWVLTVWVQVAQGWFLLGPSLTVPSPGTGGDPPARTVAFAACPGAIGWKVGAVCLADGEIADLVIQSSQCCGGSSFGVFPNLFNPE